MWWCCSTQSTFRVVHSSASVGPRTGELFGSLPTPLLMLDTVCGQPVQMLPGAHRLHANSTHSLTNMHLRRFWSRCCIVCGGAACLQGSRTRLDRACWHFDLEKCACTRLALRFLCVPLPTRHWCSPSTCCTHLYRCWLSRQAQASVVGHSGKSAREYFMTGGSFPVVLQRTPSTFPVRP